MTTLLLTYNPLTIRLGLIVFAILLVLGYLLYSIHSHRVRKARARAPEADSTPAPSPPQLFEHSVHRGPSVLVEIFRGALILLALIVAAGFVLPNLARGRYPSGSFTRMFQNFCQNSKLLIIS